MHIFAYGTLVIPEVMRRVTGRNFRCQEAFLRGYARFRVRRQTYPAILPFPDKETDGVVYYDVDDASLQRLDEFEGTLYKRTDVNVETDTREWVEAQTYIIRWAERKRLTAEPWDEIEFRERHLARFLSTYRGFSG
jgi:gamma-glutamylcyclotransferase (GGCT)/AIG2-like uncharacterized protein YtfP